jgi:drug/metabolite transporter (DMT)-like permease
VTNPALLGIGYMVYVGVANTFMLSAVKHVSETLHPFEVSFFRCAFGFLLLLPVIWRAGGLTVLATGRPGLHLLRGLLNAGGMLTFFLAISLVSLATASAISFSAPLFASLLAVIFLREKIGLHRSLALVVGFLGTIVILRPGGEVFGGGALLALGSSLLWAGAMIVIKRLTFTDSPLCITAWAAFSVGVFTLIPAIFFWRWPTLEEWGWLVLIGGLGNTVQYGFSKAFQLADATVVLPFDFLKLVWASIIGFLIFSEMPDIWTWVGGIIIFAASFYVAYRERQKGVAPKAKETTG